MCGIFYCFFKDGQCCKQKIEHLTHIVEPLVRRRGPDSFNTKEKLLFDHESGQPFKLLLMGAVLHLRGSLTPQPLEDDEGNVLIWNGEVFDGINIPEESNDTSVLSCLLGNHSNTDSHILSIMSCIQGPWSFVYYQPKEGKLWFGRDYFGRRSLIWHLPRDDDDVMAVSSVAERRDEHSDLSLVWEEVPANGIYCLETKPQMASQNHLETFKFNHFRLKKYPWTLDPKSIHSNDNIYRLQAPVKAFNKELPSESDIKGLENKHGKQNQTNGLRENAQCYSYSLANADIDMATSHRIDTLEELCNKAILSAHNSGKLTASCKKDDNFESVPETWKTSTSEGLPESFISVLGEAVRKRIFNLPRLNYKSERHSKLTCEKEELLQLSTSQDFHGKNEFADGRVGVLFSGGIDSIVLTALADRYVPKTEPIDLINVAFEQKVPKQNPTNRRKPKPANPEPKPSNFDVPDRLTGKKGVLELSTINPDRQWNFIEVNVNLKDLQQARSEHITHLVSPLNSVLDDSIGCALWFAARGSGVLRCPRCIMGAEDNSRECVHPHEYTSKAKVLLVGMGADEQLGGYARHRTKFSQQGWLGLVEEMEMEVNRISERNLGRDDRCISDHGREARFPFLDEQVVSFLSALPVWIKADLRLPRGTGEKILLRQAAKLLGLTSSTVLPKRAIQFGSRIAKLEGTTEKGSDTCSRLKLN